MSSKDEDRRSQEEGSETHENISTKPRIPYSREFLLSIGNYDLCKKLPSRFEESLSSDWEEALLRLPDRPRNAGNLPYQGFRRNDYSSSPPTRGDSSTYSRGIYGKLEFIGSCRMSSQDEDRRSQEEGSETHENVSTKPRITYSREFLLSIGNSDLCKKLPSRFEESLSSDLEEALLRLPDRPRNAGNLPYQGFGRNDYSSSPPTRGDSSTYSRGIYGKWDSRPSARSDRDPDSQSDRESDSGRRFGNQSRRPWQTPEHDGLLGSGSFPRPSGFASGVSAAKVRTNEQNQLSKSNEPYHPPRPYKAVPHIRKDTDAFNDETFGSLESTNEDRAEQERRRRASFETMRKEQHKALQEKQSNPGKNKDVLSLCEGLTDSKEEKGLVVRSSESEVSESEKSFLSSQAHAPRPLVPPGFKTTLVEKSSGLKSLIHPSMSEVFKPLISESSVDAETNLNRNANDRVENLVGGDPLEKTQHPLLLNNGEDVNAYVSLNEPKLTVVEDQSLRISGNGETQGLLHSLAFTKLNAEALEDKAVRDSSRSNSTSIFEKIFGSTLSTKNEGHLGSTQLLSNQPDDAWSPKSAHSSKFAQWFSEEEAKAAADVSNVVQNNLLSLIVGSDKANGVSDQACNNNKEDLVPAVLTCEDLEQSILSEFGAKTTNIQPDSKSWSAAGVESTGNADNHASLHLLSILQKSSEQPSTAVTSVNISLPEKQVVSHEHDRTTVGNASREEQNGNSSLTLEALFGTAFMKELQSVGAPVSVQRGTSGSSRVDAEPHAFFTVGDNDMSSSAVENSGPQRPGHDYDVPSNRRQIATISGADNWLGFSEPSTGISSPKHQTESLNRHGGFENLISAGNNRDPRVLPIMPGGNLMNNLNMSSSTPIHIAEKLAAFGGVIKDKHGMGGSEMPFQHNSYEQRGPDVPYSNLQSPQQFQPPQINQARPLYHHLESHPTHMNSPLKFLSPEPTFGRNSPSNHQLASSPMMRPPFHHPNVRVSGFDVPPQQSVLHQLQMAGKHPPQFERGGPPPHHEMNQMQGLPFGRGPSSGVPVPGNPPPEAFQRLIEMELRANSKQMHPFGPPPPGHNQGIYSHELDMESRYR